MSTPLPQTATTGYAVAMGSTPRSIRFDEQVLAQLDRYVREHPGSSISSVANMFIDESLRAHEHPGIVFRPGPTGRRAGLAAGPDVWEVIAALHAIKAESPDLAGDELTQALAVSTGLHHRAIVIALRYYAAYPEEVDERIAANQAVAEQEERLWQAEQVILRRRVA